MSRLLFKKLGVYNRYLIFTKNALTVTEVELGFMKIVYSVLDSYLDEKSHRVISENWIDEETNSNFSTRLMFNTSPIFCTLFGSGKM